MLKTYIQKYFITYMLKKLQNHINLLIQLYYYLEPSEPNKEATKYCMCALVRDKIGLCIQNFI